MQSQRKFLFLGRLISIKFDSRFLSKIILNSLCLVYKYFSLKAHSQVFGSWEPFGSWQFWAAESPLKVMTNAFYFTSKALFVFKMYKFLSWLFGQVTKLLDKKDKINFKFYNVTAWLTNNCNIHNAQYLE